MRSLHAFIVCSSELSSDWRMRLLDAPVAGLPLLKRHLLGLQDAGVSTVTVIVSATDPLSTTDLHAMTPAGMTVRCETARPALPLASIVVTQDAAVVVDPRLIHDVIALAARTTAAIESTDVYADQYPVVAKSPYIVGVPLPGEVAPVADATTPCPIGLSVAIEGATSPATMVSVGRYYWHRMRSAADADAATTKVLLATMKPTDGIYARNNRRVSLHISRLLLSTRVTPNMVTWVDFLCSAFAGVLLAMPGYAFGVAGALLAWCASMVDGVDGELARARFETSAYGAWLETICAYVFYFAILIGLAIGGYRTTHESWYLLAGGVGALSASLTFISIGRMKSQYARTQEIGEFGHAFQRTLDEQPVNPLARTLRKLQFLVGRAGYPYFVVIFAVFNWHRPLMFLSLVGTVAAAGLCFYTANLSSSPFRETTTDAPARPAQA